MLIYGAGMAGLLAANMLRRHNPTVHDISKSLPDNHGALLRFRSPDVAEATGQKFKRVLVHKGIHYKGTLHDRADLAMMNLYSQKVTGEVHSRSIINMEPSYRYIAPDDFIKAMVASIGLDRIKLGSPLTREVVEEVGGREPIISTVPMPVLMKEMGWENESEFKAMPIWSFQAKIATPFTNIYQTIYYPDPHHPYYRASVTGDRVIVEYAAEEDEWMATDHAIEILSEDFGIIEPELSHPTLKHQSYGKLLPIPDHERRAFILAMTDRHRIYSVGRFATWRQILMDDVVQDINIVSRFMEERDNYSRHISRHLHPW